MSNLERCSYSLQEKMMDLSISVPSPASTARFGKDEVKIIPADSQALATYRTTRPLEVSATSIGVLRTDPAVAGNDRPDTHIYEIEPAYSARVMRLSRMRPGNIAPVTMKKLFGIRGWIWEAHLVSANRRSLECLFIARKSGDTIIWEDKEGHLVAIEPIRAPSAATKGYCIAPYLDISRDMDEITRDLLVTLHITRIWQETLLATPTQRSLLDVVKAVLSGKACS